MSVHEVVAGYEFGAAENCSLEMTIEQKPMEGARQPLDNDFIRLACGIHASVFLEGYPSRNSWPDSGY